MEHGAVLWDSCYPGCNATTAVIQLFTRVANDFFFSPAYTRMGGRPVLREFAMEAIPLPSGQTNTSWNVVDWNAVQAQVPGNPLIIHRNLEGFAKAQSGGAFSWMEPKTLDSEPANYDGTDELDWFYSNAVASDAAMPAFGAAWKGFNDILASWAPSGGRHIEQNCGQTWLRTFAAVNRYYSSSRQLTALQLVTWNDYEEGSEVETGIDNCVSVSATVSGTSLQWTHHRRLQHRRSLHGVYLHRRGKACFARRFFHFHVGPGSLALHFSRRQLFSVRKGGGQADVAQPHVRGRPADHCDFRRRDRQEHHHHRHALVACRFNAARRRNSCWP